MARIRTVKPTFWTSEQVLNCKPLTRLLFIGMWNFADDWGRMAMAPKSIKAQVFPGDEDVTIANVSDMLLELSNLGLIVIYSANDREYLEITGWSHQKIDRPQKSNIPPPFSESNQGKIVEDSSNDRRMIAPDSKGEEGIGGESNAASPPPPPSRSRKRQAVRLPDDWRPDQSARDYASRQGLSSGEIAREVEKFRNHARANDRTASDWGAAWRNWCVKAAEFLNKPPPADPSAPQQQLFRALPGSPSFRAWQRYCASRDDPASRTMRRQLEHRELEGRPYEFPSEWPPGYVKTTEAA